MTLRFEAQNDAIASIKLFDLTGKLIYQSELNAVKGMNNPTVQIPELKNGTYTLLFSLSGITEKEKVIKI